MMPLRTIYKNIKLTFLLLIFSSFHGCNEAVKADAKLPPEVKKTRTSLISLLNNPVMKKTIKYQLIQIVDLKKSTEITTDKLSKLCGEWRISDDIVRKILTISNPIPEAEKHYLYDIKACSYDIKLEFNDQTFLITTNGGGWTTIMNKAKTDYLLLGCNINECKKYFLSRGNRPDE